jgi:predicted RND superfamily exporter protein
MSRINVKQNRVQHKFRSAAMNMKETKHRASMSIAIDFEIRNRLRQYSQIIATSSATNGTKNNSNFVNVVVINIKTTIMTAADHNKFEIKHTIIPVVLVMVVVVVVVVVVLFWWWRCWRWLWWWYQWWWLRG